MTNQTVQEKLWHLSFRKLYDSEFFIPVEKEKRIRIENAFHQPYKKYALELGPGWGEVAIQLALTNPDTAYILLEKKMKRISRILNEIRKTGLTNIRIIPADFSHFLGNIFQPEQFDEIILNFPDPWPKKKHWKNRIVQNGFIHIIYQLLAPDGDFHFATDYGPYARKVIRLLREDKRFGFKVEVEFKRDFIPVSFFEKEKQAEVPRLYYLSRKKLIKYD